MGNTIGLDEILRRNGITQVALASELGMEVPTLNRKIRGHRSWRVDEVIAVAAFLRRYEPGLDVESLFGSDAA